MNTIFNSNISSCALSFEREGYCVVEVGVQCANALEQLYHELYSHKPSEFYSNHRHEVAAFNHTINKRISEIVVPVAKKIGLNFQPVLGSFAIKPAHYSEEFKLHQDWSIVDEKKYVSAQLWIPLIDVNASNGGLFILPQSDRFFNNLRSATYPIAQIPRNGILKYLAPVIPLKKGQAILFKHATFHGSVSNLTDQERPAVIFSIMSTDAKMIYYQKRDDQTADAYGIDPGFYLHHVPQVEKGNIPAGYTPIDTKPFTYFQITTMDLIKRSLINLFC